MIEKNDRIPILQYAGLVQWKIRKKDSVICKPHAMNKTAKTGFCKVWATCTLKKVKIKPLKLEPHAM